MTWLVLVPVLVSAALGVAGPRFASRTHPGAGLWSMTIGAAVAAAGTCWSLLLLAATLLDDEFNVPRIDVPVPDWVSILCLLLLLTGLGRLVHTGWHRYRRHRDLRAACSGYPSGELVVLDDPAPRAFALPGRPGRVVVSSGMLDALSPGERRVLLAHERAHLDGHHDWHLALVSAASSVNPMLRPVDRVVRFLCERSADERAAARVGDRVLTATALARAALAGLGGPRTAPSFAHLGVAARVNALGTPPPRHWLPWSVAVAGLVLAIAGAEITATWDFLDLVRHAVRW